MRLLIAGSLVRAQLEEQPKTRWSQRVFCFSRACYLRASSDKHGGHTDRITQDMHQYCRKNRSCPPVQSTRDQTKHHKRRYVPQLPDIPSYYPSRGNVLKGEKDCGTDITDH